MAERAYFDWNATAPLREEARIATIAALEVAGNASSVHAEGRAARSLVERAREQVANLVGADAKNVTFTSGATEANMYALTPAIEIGGRKEPRDRLFVSAIEHPSVRSGGRFAAEQVEALPVTGDGVVDLVALKAAVTRAERPLVSIMLANNETGVIQPIAQIADTVHAANGVLHVDAVQGPGRIDCDVDALGADLLSISSHKLGGPQGAGALVRRGDIHIAEPLIKGGGQERGQRAGTENVVAIAGFGAAAIAATQMDVTRMAALRDRLESDLKAATPAGCGFRRRRPAPPQYDIVRGSRPEGRNSDNRFRSQWDSGFFRFRMLVRQGAGVACAGGDGGGSFTFTRCSPRQPWLDHHRSRSRSAVNCLE